ncbi:MAG: DUF1353 domain-containing protein [Paracoccaceae bacterium]|nr:DUF1353 domain-containing protein [Paracoccaceae bacterium]
MRTLPNPYPAKGSWNKITDFAFVGDLVVKRFSEALRIRHGSDLETDAEFVVCEPYQISYRLDRGEQRTVTVEKGFLSDGVSVLGNNERTRKYLEASIVHDYLYVAWQFLETPHERRPRKWDQKFADKLFHIALLKSPKVTPDEAWFIYRAVKSFGWSTYREKDPDSFVSL